jgi:hypothetical protein
MEAKDNLALEKLASLFQRRYNIVSELKKETDELSEAMQRQDNMSLDLLLDLRQEALNKLENNWIEMNLLAEETEELGKIFHKLLNEDPKNSTAYPFLERRILELRGKIVESIHHIQERDSRINTQAKQTRKFLWENIPSELKEEVV